MLDNEIIIKYLNNMDGKEHIGIYCSDSNNTYDVVIKLTDIIQLINELTEENKKLKKNNVDMLSLIIDKLKTKANTKVDTLTGDISFYVLTPQQLDISLHEVKRRFDIDDN